MRVGVPAGSRGRENTKGEGAWCVQVGLCGHHRMWELHIGAGALRVEDGEVFCQVELAYAIDSESRWRP